MSLSRSRLSLLLVLAAIPLAACNPAQPPATTPSSGTAAPALTSASALALLPPVVPVPAPVVPPELMAGKKAFDQTCGLCHGAGTGGAPRPGDKAAWAHRIAQGNETLYKHALEGFEGSAGYMPPRGGTALPDADVKAGVDYMVALSK